MMREYQTNFLRAADALGVLGPGGSLLLERIHSAAFALTSLDGQLMADDFPKRMKMLENARVNGIRRRAS